MKHLLSKKGIIGALLLLATGTAPVAAQTVYDGSNRSIGKVESNGTVRDGSNRQIGQAKGVKREWAAVFFFFSLFK